LGRSAGSFLSNTNTNAYIGLDVIMIAADATEIIGNNNNNNNDAAAASSSAAPISLPPNRFELEVSPVFL
jgi:hypothetical protein